MDQIFAPWRIDWVEREGEIDGCPFCVLPAEDDDRANHVVARSEHSFVLLNNSPYNPGHAMVIPNRHTGEYPSLDAVELQDHSRLTQSTITSMESAFDPDGFNAGLNLGGTAGGGSIDDHLHTHVVPRWNGDTNFMPVVGETKVIVEAIDDSFDKLRAAFAELPEGTSRGEDSAVAIEFE